MAEGERRVFCLTNGGEGEGAKEVDAEGGGDVEGDVLWERGEG